MKRTIMNPHRVNHRLYIFLVLLSPIILVGSLIIPTSVVEENDYLETFFDVLKNLSFGCIASVLVAWIIDCANTKHLNMKANNVYDAVYRDLRFRIGVFIASWAELCAVAFKDNDYYGEKHTWVTWYEITKDNYYKRVEQKWNWRLILIYRNKNTRNAKTLKLQKRRLNEENSLWI